MPLVVTEAVVLHVFDYLESSRILRLMTDEVGIRSVLARGARRSSRRFGTALDLFAQGSAQIHVKPGRDLDTLGGFDVSRARPSIGADLGRFTGAEMVAELTLRFARDDADPELYATVVAALDALAAAPAAAAREAALGGAWRIVAALGFGPSLDVCCECHASLAPANAVLFSHPAGGALCTACARLAPAGRLFPAAARATLRAWMRGDQTTSSSDGELRAHQRLLREFVHEHLSDERPLRAFAIWEHAAWGSDAPAAVRGQ